MPAYCKVYHYKLKLRIHAPLVVSYVRGLATRYPGWQGLEPLLYIFSFTFPEPELSISGSGFSSINFPKDSVIPDILDTKNSIGTLPVTEFNVR